jgi:hypothetical protein
VSHSFAGSSSLPLTFTEQGNQFSYTQNESKQTDYEDNDDEEEDRIIDGRYSPTMHNNYNNEEFFHSPMSSYNGDFRNFKYPSSTTISVSVSPKSNPESVNSEELSLLAPNRPKNKRRSTPRTHAVIFWQSNAERQGARSAINSSNDDFQQRRSSEKRPKKYLHKVRKYSQTPNSSNRNSFAVSGKSKKNGKHNLDLQHLLKNRNFKKTKNKNNGNNKNSNSNKSKSNRNSSKSSVKSKNQINVNMTRHIRRKGSAPDIETAAVSPNSLINLKNHNSDGSTKNQHNTGIQHYLSDRGRNDDDEDEDDNDNEDEDDEIYDDEDEDEDEYYFEEDNKYPLKALTTNRVHIQQKSKSKTIKTIKTNKQTVRKKRKSKSKKHHPR